MNELKMILVDGTEVALEAFGLPMHAVVTCATDDEVHAIVKQLTAANLGRVTVQLDGEAVYTFAGGQLDGVQTVYNVDSVTAHIYMSGVRLETVSDTTQEYVTAANILLGEEE